jgi:glutathione S-transferase
MEAKLYVILGSHACRTGILLLEHKGIEYERVVLPTGFHPLMLRLHGFSGNPAPFRKVDGGRHVMVETADRMGTVPALKVDGQRVKTNRAIARFLEELRPDPPLFPEDPAKRAAVEEAERWGDEVFQMTARRLILAAAVRGGDAIHAGGDEGRLGPLLWHGRRVREMGSKMLGRFVFPAGGKAEAELRAALPEQLDHIDALIEEGVLNGERLYAADLMIVPSLALLTYSSDLRPEIERRPAIRLVDRVLPDPQASAAVTAAA